MCGLAPGVSAASLQVQGSRQHMARLLRDIHCHAHDSMIFHQHSCVIEALIVFVKALRLMNFPSHKSYLAPMVSRLDGSLRM